MLKRGRRDGGDQRVAVAIELVVPATRDGMAEIMPLEPRQRRARFIRGPRLARFGLRDPRLGDFSLRPQPARMPPDVTSGIALIHKAAGRRVAIAQGRRQQFTAVAPRRTTGDALKALQQPSPFRLMPGLDTDGLDLRPVLLKVL